MVRYDKTQSVDKPLSIEFAGNKVFIAHHLQEIERFSEDGTEKLPSHYEFILDEYSRDEYLIKQYEDLSYIASLLDVDLNNINQIIENNNLEEFL